MARASLSGFGRAGEGGEAGVAEACRVAQDAPEAEHACDQPGGAQAGDIREANKRELIESGARREVLMMVPVVFLVLPVTVVFAFYPGVVGIQLIAG